MNGNKRIELIQGALQKSKYRWATIAALLLAIGSIMRIIGPRVAGDSPNWVVAMYVIAILIVKPNISKAVAIGLFAGAINTLTSKSPLPHIALLSEPVGALVCVFLVGLPFALKIGPVSFRPAVIALITTLASGFTFITTFKLIMGVPMQVYLYGMMPVVLFTAFANAVLAQVLHYPAEKALKTKEGNYAPFPSSEAIRDKDAGHYGFELTLVSQEKINTFQNDCDLLKTNDAMLERQRQDRAGQDKTADRMTFDIVSVIRRRQKILLIIAFLVTIFSATGAYYYYFQYYSMGEIQSAIEDQNGEKLGKIFKYSIAHPRYENLAKASIAGIVALKDKQGLDSLNDYMKGDMSVEHEGGKYKQLLQQAVIREMQSKRQVLSEFFSIAEKITHPLRSDVITAITASEPSWFAQKIKNISPQPDRYLDGRKTSEEISADLVNYKRQCQLWVIDADTKSLCARESVKRYGELLKRAVYTNTCARQDAIFSQVENELGEQQNIFARTLLIRAKNKHSEYLSYCEERGKLKSQIMEGQSEQRQIENKMRALQREHSILEDMARRAFLGSKEINRAVEIGLEFTTLYFRRDDIQQKIDVLEQRERLLSQVMEKTKGECVSEISEFINWVY